MANKIKLFYRSFKIRNPAGKEIIIPKPIITVVVNYAHGRMLTINALIDSGSDYNLFPGDLGKAMGLNLKKGGPTFIRGIGGKKIKAFRHRRIGIFVNGYKLDTYADFSEEHDIPILGQNGFFDFFKAVTFKRKSEGAISLSHKSILAFSFVNPRGQSLSTNIRKPSDL